MRFEINQDTWNLKQTRGGATENAGLENVAPDCRGGKRGTGKRGTRLQGWKTRE